MLVLLLIATRVASEWVEISQYQRREDPARRASVGYRGAGEPNKAYANHSLTEHSWHMSGISRGPNIGTVKRVQLQGKEKATISPGGFAKSTLVKAMTVDRAYESVGHVRAPNKKILKEIFESDIVEREFNVDNSGTINEPKNQFYNRAQYSDLKNDNSTKGPNVLNTNTQIKISAEEGDIGETKYEPLEVKPHVRTVSISGTSKGVNLDKEIHVNIRGNSKENEHKAAHSPAGRILSDDVTISTNNKTLHEDQNAPPLNPYSPNTFKHNIKYNFDPNVNRKINTESQQGNQVKREDINMDGNTKTNTVQVLWKLMKIVTDNISRNTRRSFRSKIRYLEDLRNDIIANIAERVEQAWPDDTGAEAGRTRRRRSEAARGHVEFPSSESALMTISFLTFAVFLIKLVLQVIHTYKNKTMMVTPAVVAAVGRTAASFKQKIVP